MKKIINFIVRSSADPRKISMTVKSAALGIIPIILYTTGAVCQLGYTCVSVSPGQLEALAEGAAELAFIVLSIVSLVGMFLGLLRKIYLTLTGYNDAIK